MKKLRKKVVSGINKGIIFTIESEFGFCHYSFESDSIGEYSHIYNLFVFPQYRRKGHAKALIIEAIKNIRAVGYNNEIQIVANPSDKSIDKDDLKKFYSSLGLSVFDEYL